MLYLCFDLPLMLQSIRGCEFKSCIVAGADVGRGRGAAGTSGLRRHCRGTHAALIKVRGKTLQGLPPPPPLFS